jgi:uroporphyrinogen-III synthase
VTFTSAPAVRNLFAIAEEDGAADDLRAAMNTKTVAACVGPACADSARAMGIEEPLAPDVGRLGLMVRLLSEWLQASRLVLDLGGTPVEVQGQAMLVGDEHVQLTRREAGVFNVLAARNGVVVSPTTLLRTVWGSAAGDEHVVGVTIGRLRRKLGGSGSSVRTVPRRGYRLEVTPPARTGVKGAE